MIISFLIGVTLGIIVSCFLFKAHIKIILKRIKQNQFELKRQIFHMIMGLMVAGSIYFFKKSLIVISFSIILVVCLILTYVLKTGKLKLPIILWVLNQFERKKDVIDAPFKGVLFF